MDRIDNLITCEIFNRATRITDDHGVIDIRLGPLRVALDAFERAHAALFHELARVEMIDKADITTPSAGSSTDAVRAG